MAGNTQCYRVTIDAAGGLAAEVVQFSPRYADNVGNAMHRLANGPHLQPPIIRFQDWPELQRRWAERAVSA